MADGIETFDQNRNMARVTAGFKGGPFYQKPNLAPSMNFVDGVDPLVREKLQAGSIPQPTPIDTWNMRRSNSSMK